MQREATAGRIGPLSDGPLDIRSLGTGPLGTGPLSTGPLSTGPLGTGPLGTGVLGRGPLRNGNRRGDPNLAPRCGAKARTGCPCRSPAMANGRCRMHGGASTGPTTLDGLARLRATHTKHGFYGAESQAALRRTDAFIVETRALLARLRVEAGEADAAATRGGKRG